MHSQALKLMSASDRRANKCCKISVPTATQASEARKTRPQTVARQFESMPNIIPKRRYRVHTQYARPRNRGSCTARWGSRCCGIFEVETEGCKMME